MKYKIIICDIDGTVADIRHRMHFIDPTIAVGDIVRPVGIPNAKYYHGVVTHISHFVGVSWRCPKGSISLKTSYVFPYDDLIKKVRNWRLFFESAIHDSAIKPNVELVLNLSKTYPILFCSGRPEKYRKITMEWLDSVGLGELFRINEGSNLAYTNLLMRPDNDTREDFIVKKELLDKHITPFYSPIVAIDDRSQVVKMWRDNGVNCWQVAEGNF